MDRLTIRQRPAGRPVMLQTWDKLLFLHWPMPVNAVRPLVPEPLAIDTWEGEAWVAVAPFTMRGLRPPRLPPVPWLSRTHELNVRTYVHHEGVPGVWFFSLDAASVLAVIGARLAFRLPYYLARMTLQEAGGAVRFRSRRRHPGARPAEFSAEWRPGSPLPDLEPGTRDFFLIERYCLYAARRGAVHRARIFHRPWPLREARLDRLASTMLEAAGLPPAAGDPVVHLQREPLEVEVWPPERVADGRS